MMLRPATSQVHTAQSMARHFCFICTDGVRTGAHAGSTTTTASSEGGGGEGRQNAASCSCGLPSGGTARSSHTPPQCSVRGHTHEVCGHGGCLTTGQPREGNAEGQGRWCGQQRVPRGLPKRRQSSQKERGPRGLPHREN
eukprot:1159519-Pelagomonas_calceolata.AAC.17